MAARSLSLMSVCALSIQRGIAPRQSGEREEQNLARDDFLAHRGLDKKSSSTDWNTLSFNWSLGHLNFCLFFSEMNLRNRNTCRQKWKTGKKTYFPRLLLWRRGWWEGKKSQNGPNSEKQPAISIVASQRCDGGCDSQWGVFVSVWCFPSVTAWASSHGPQSSKPDS